MAATKLPTLCLGLARVSLSRLGAAHLRSQRFGFLVFAVAVAVAVAAGGRRARLARRAALGDGALGRCALGRRRRRLVAAAVRRRRGAVAVGRGAGGRGVLAGRGGLLQWCFWL